MHCKESYRPGAGSAAGSGHRVRNVPAVPCRECRFWRQSACRRLAVRARPLAVLPAREGGVRAGQCSGAFPFLTPADLMRFVNRRVKVGETAVVREFVNWAVRPVPRQAGSDRLLPSAGPAGTIASSSPRGDCDTSCGSGGGQRRGCAPGQVRGKLGGAFLPEHVRNAAQGRRTGSPHYWGFEAPIGTSTCEVIRKSPRASEIVGWALSYWHGCPASCHRRPAQRRQIEHLQLACRQAAGHRRPDGRGDPRPGDPPDRHPATASPNWSTPAAWASKTSTT